jgi:multicomponent K+:H+ antiporter subunit A
MSILFIVLLPLLGAALPALIHHSRNIGAWCSAAVTGFALVLLLGLMPDVLDGDTIIYSREWVPAIGLNLSFRLDGLGLA